jgi:enoyl-CoA hydratase/carnithine racemase
VGGGLEWVINCDFALAAEGARFFFPEVGLGVFVTGGVTELLPRLVGLRRARSLIMLGEKFDAAQGLEWGLLTKVVADAALMEEALALARRVAALPRGPVRDLRRILARRGGAGLEAALAAETDATVRGFLDPETAARVAAFG